MWITDFHLVLSGFRKCGIPMDMIFQGILMSLL